MSHIPSAADLLARFAKGRAQPSQATDSNDLLADVRGLAGDELGAHVAGVDRRENVLVVWVDGAGWSARAHYVLQPQLGNLQQRHPWLGQLAVRVLRTRVRSAG